MNHRYSLVLTLTFTFFLVNTAFSQQGRNSNEDLALLHAREIYAASLADQAAMYSGVDYIGYPHPIKKGQQFFISGDVRRGEIRYDGMVYRNVPMWFDIAKQEVVVQYIDNYSRISLHPERISDFTIEGHHFIRISGESAKQYGLGDGFYDQIYKGNSEVLVKRAKDFLISTDTDGVWISFSGDKSDIYVRTGDKFHSVSSQKSVLDVLGKYQKEVLAHLKQNKIKFRKEREKAIVMMLAYFDQLNSQR